MVSSPIRLLLEGAAGLAASLGLAIWLGRVERRPMGDYGLGLAAGRQAIGGAVTGLGAMGLAVGALWALGGVHESLARSGIFSAAGEALIWAGALAMVAAAQESVFRGWLLATLARRWGYMAAAGISSLLFAAIHLFASGETGAGLAGLFLFGLAACAATRARGSIWWAVGFHAAWDFALTFIFGFGAGSGSGVLLTMTPSGPAWLSGGAAGPEGGLITMAILVVLAAYPVIPQSGPKRPPKRPR